MAVSDDTAIVGPWHSGDAAYVFVKPADGWSDMTQTAKLTASAAAGESFGNSVDISGDTAVVGARYLNAAYVFIKPAGGWRDMTQTAKLTASDGIHDASELRVAVNGDTVIVGDRLNDVNGIIHSGSAYVFVRSENGWSDMTQTTKLIASDAAAGDLFGLGVAVSGNTAIIGAYADDNDNGTDSGSVYVICINDLTPEINLKQSETDIANGGSYDFDSQPLGTHTDTVITIENTGATDLILTTLPLAITGDDAVQFSIHAQPTSPVAPGESTEFTVRFSPVSTGAKTATISISSNDSDENPYELTVTGEILKGDLNGDGVTDLADAIVALQVITGYNPALLRTDYVVSGTDVNGDGKVGMEEVIYILQEEGELR
ncbi:choice-of-anchor D domain-containing protein [Desulfococcaceae bacterium HSG7]|nr:choice-of-anchor D domain-containing protein [Desulfococcaceae bacterium HSG7]